MFTNVIVLTPNGRRQNVKTNPNTTILQILEEACRKHDFKPEEFDLRHHRNVLDTTIPLRFSGLPNNALLEMIPAVKTRNAEADIMIAVQLEDGRRLTGNFKPQSKVSDVLTNVCPNEVGDNAVVIYMRRELHGPALSETSLKDLGITNGRAMLRLMHRSPDELKTQANVSAPLPSKPVEEKPYVRKLQHVEPQPFPAQIPKSAPKVSSVGNDNLFEETDFKQPVNKVRRQTDDKEDVVRKVVMEKKRKQHEKCTMLTKSEEVSSEQDVEEDDFIFLGERNAMLFSNEMAKTVPSEDLLDDFFELTINDAKKLLRDLKKQRLSQDNGKLQTSAMRELEESKRQLRLLNLYKKAVIRVQFPNMCVLQGTFTPAETVNHVVDFVRDYLEDKSLDFYLYTTPPKEILSPTSRLIDIGCVPGALLHFGSNSSENVEYLRNDLRNRFTSLSKASLVATKTRQANPNRVMFDEDVEDIDDEMTTVASVDDVNKGASTSTGITCENYSSKRPVAGHEEKKVPKWFKAP